VYETVNELYNSCEGERVDLQQPPHFRVAALVPHQRLRQSVLFGSSQEIVQFCMNVGQTKAPVKLLPSSSK